MFLRNQKSNSAASAAEQRILDNLKAFLGGIVEELRGQFDYLKKASDGNVQLLERCARAVASMETRIVELERRIAELDRTKADR